MGNATWIFLFVLLGFVFWRVILPTMKMERDESAAEKQTTTVEPDPNKGPSFYKKGREWVFEDGWKFILGVLVLGVVWYFWGSIAGFFPSLKPSFTFDGMMDFAVPFAIVVALVFVVSFIIGGDKAKVFRKGVWVVVVAFFAIGLLALYQDWKSDSGIFTSTKPSASVAVNYKPPLASDPESTWPKLEMSAKGNSREVKVPPFMHMVVRGDDFQTHVIYRGGKDCTVGESCPDGAIEKAYVVNTSAGRNIVSYAFAPM